MRSLLRSFLSFLASAYGGAANAQVSDDAVRIGVLGDLSGSMPISAARATSLQPGWPSKTSAAKCLANQSMS